MSAKPKYSSFINSVVLLSFSVFLSFQAISQTPHDTVTAKVRFDKKYVFSYWHDTKKIVASPFHWKAKQWLTFTGVAGISVVTYVYDKEIYDFFRQNRTTSTENISKYAVEPWGSGLYSLPLLAGIYLTGIHNNRHKNVALTGLKAYLLSGGAVQVAKYIFHRHRPGDNDPPDPYLWDGPFPFTTGHVSFPSGHTTTAFAVASVLAYGYRDKPWIGITSYSMATLVGISRIHDGKHWPTDVIAGAALGTFIGITLSKINLTTNPKFAINPIPVQGGCGLSVGYRLN